MPHTSNPTPLIQAAKLEEEVDILKNELDSKRLLLESSEEQVSVWGAGSNLASTLLDSTIKPSNVMNKLDGQSHLQNPKSQPPTPTP